MTPTAFLLGAFESHSPEGIRSALDAGASPTDLIDGTRPIVQLVEMYTRSPRFADCLHVMLEAGATLDDPLLEALLLDDPDRLDPAQHNRSFHLKCAYTSLQGVTPLHICAEYNSLRCARKLLEAGADVNAPALLDPDGLGGQTPLFHAVNSNRNYCRAAMELLVDAGASLDIQLKGLVWGGSFDWETTIFDVTPISYAQCGLYFQFHRREEAVYSNLRYLYHKRYGTDPPIRNVPNRYLDDERVFPPRM